MFRAPLRESGTPHREKAPPRHSLTRRRSNAVIQARLLDLVEAKRRMSAMSSDQSTRAGHAVPRSGRVRGRPSLQETGHSTVGEVNGEDGKDHSDRDAQPGDFQPQAEPGGRQTLEHDGRGDTSDKEDDPGQREPENPNSPLFPPRLSGRRRLVHVDAIPLVERSEPLAPTRRAMCFGAEMRWQALHDTGPSVCARFLAGDQNVGNARKVSHRLESEPPRPC